MESEEEKIFQSFIEFLLNYNASDGCVAEKVHFI